MEPPSYEEASRLPPTQPTAVFNLTPPPPAYDTSISFPPSPPPAYGEAVTVQPDPFPVLVPPPVPSAVSSPPQNTGAIVHPLTQIGVRSQVNSRQTQPIAVVSQPRPVPILVECLRDAPGYICCPHCNNLVTTKVTNVPGTSAWCLCVFLVLMGLICGFCLIPLMVQGLQDAHHSCPQCENIVHVHKR